MRRPPARPERDSTIALINIVFLMLIFFLVAGTLAQPLDPGLTLVRSADLEGNAPPEALVLHPDGRLTLQGREVTAAQALQMRPTLAQGGLAQAGTVRIVPDRAAPAARLVQVARELRAAGAARVMIVSERGLQ